MSKASKLRTAIASYNVSECVQCGGEIQKDWLIPTDLNHWAGLEVVTVDSLEEILDARHSYSDFHKEVNGFRPRHSTSDWTLTKWRETYAYLARENEDQIASKQAFEARKVQEFKDSITRIQKAGAKEFLTALRWMLQADDVNPKDRRGVECFFWDRDILESSYAKSLINRICPIRH